MGILSFNSVPSFVVNVSGLIGWFYLDCFPSHTRSIHRSRSIYVASSFFKKFRVIVISELNHHDKTAPVLPVKRNKRSTVNIN